MAKSKLTPDQEEQLISLLGLLQFPCSSRVFDAWCGSTITNPFELAVLRRTAAGAIEILLTPYPPKGQVRFWPDGEWHLPGTVIIPGTTIEDAFKRLIAREVGVPTSPPEFIRIREFPKGNRVRLGENPRGQEISLLHAVFVGGVESPHGKFFPIDAVPNTTLGHHKVMLNDVREWLATRNAL